MAGEAAEAEKGPRLTEKHRRIGRALLASGPVSHGELLEEIRTCGRPPGVLEEALLHTGFPPEDGLIAASLVSYRIPRIRLDEYTLSPDVLKSISGEVAVRTRAVPMARIGSILVVATPHIDARRASALRCEWRGKVILLLASPEEVEEALRAHYPAVYAWARALPAVRSGDLEPQTLVPAMGRSGDLPAWWTTAITGEGPVVPSEAPELE